MSLAQRAGQTRGSIERPIDDIQKQFRNRLSSLNQYIAVKLIRLLLFRKVTDHHGSGYPSELTGGPSFRVKVIALPFPVQRKEGGFADTKPGYDHGSYCREPQFVHKGAWILCHDNADQFPKRASLRQSLFPLSISQSLAQCLF